ncbi:MAG TPA: hypothetical protein VHO03_05805 [Ignavibacteriales bacterium]|nr:hypothetical protein [Ignavibacteriales bacterium]
MKVITLYQPWAQWIIWGWKTIETRTHSKFNCLKGQRIAIHAAKAYDSQAFNAAERYMTPEQRRIHMNCEEEGFYDMGAILGTALVWESGRLSSMHARGALIECGSMVRHGLFLKEVKELRYPIHVSGHQGIWDFVFKGDEEFFCSTKNILTNVEFIELKK